MPPDAPSNPTGHWEPGEIVAIHERILASAGSSWRYASGFSPAWFVSDIAPTFTECLADALRRDYGEAPLFVVKDPRLCHLVPLWRAVLAEFGATPLAVIPVRNPLEIATSLERRDGLFQARSILMWLWHFLTAERDTRELKRSFVRYDQLLRDWRVVVDKIGSDLDINWARQSHAADAEIENFLSPELRHNGVPDSELYARRDIATWVKTAFRWATKAAEGQPTDPEELDTIASHLATADALFMPLVAHSETTISQLSEELQRERGERDERIAELEGAIAARDDEMTAREGHIAELGSVIAARDSEIAARDSEIAARDGEIARLNTEIAAIHKSTSWRVSRPIRTVGGRIKGFWRD